MSTHSHLEHHFATPEQQRDTAIFGMWIFLGTEVLFFGGLFMGYTFLRWSSPVTVETASRHLELILGSINTAILLTSSFIMTLGIHFADRHRPRKAAAMLAITAALGIAFLCIKATEYSRVIHEGLLPGTGFRIDRVLTDSKAPAPIRRSLGPKLTGSLFEEDRSTRTRTRPELHVDPFQSGISGALGPGSGVDARRVVPGIAELFFWLYFVMTGLHAVHLLIGVVMSLIVAFMLREPSGVSANTIHNVGLYWHFVDMVWVFLFPLLYLAGHW